MTFEQAAISYFSKPTMIGLCQRIDGVHCFSNLSAYWFWEYRLNRLVKKGILKRFRTSSMWLSCNGMYAYGLATPPQEGE